MMIRRLKAMLSRRPADDSASGAGQRPSRAVEVGWLLETDKAHFIWAEPQRFRRDDPTPVHAKAVNYCPSVLDHEARLFQVLCPIDVRLGFRRNDKGQPLLVNADGDRAAVRTKRLNEFVTLAGEGQWRHPERPVLQINTPYVFVSDEPVFLVQMPPFNHYQASPLPGTLIGGRLPIHIWPRRLMWAFEWYDTSKDLILKRGEPWFYVRFDTEDPTRPVRLVEAELTPELEAHRRAMTSVAGYVNQTYSLLKVASERRPPRLLKAKPAAVKRSDV